jgi:hypothetical protein
MTKGKMAGNRLPELAFAKRILKEEVSASGALMGKP